MRKNEKNETLKKKVEIEERIREIWNNENIRVEWFLKRERNERKNQ